MSIMTDRTRTDLLEVARDLAPSIRASADQIERDRRLPDALADAMADAGLFKMLVPRALGGSEADPETLLVVVEEVARADASAGWSVAVGAVCGVVAGFLREDVASEMFADPRACLVGSGAPAPPAPDRPPDRGVAVDGGFRITGRWAFSSGCRHATWLLGVSAVDAEASREHANGSSPKRTFFFPVAECQIADTWHVTGLRGTGSHEFAVVDVFVPKARSLPCSPVSPSHSGPLYAFAPGIGGDGRTAQWANTTIVAFAAVGLGIARGVLDAFMDLAGAKARGNVLLRDNPVVQAQIGQAEAMLRAARAYLTETTRDLWRAAQENGGTSREQQTLLRLAGSHAAVLAAQSVDIVWSIAGASAIFTSSPLERRFRDVHTLTQNIAVSSVHYGGAGQLFLGVDADRS
jgi:alkylation response protein AidB-like acyl-CoA dehydrogenase